MDQELLKKVSEFLMISQFEGDYVTKTELAEAVIKIIEDYYGF